MKRKEKKDYVKIGDKKIGYGYPCFIIAEAGSNHNGKFSTVKRLISVAAERGADAIKFQLFTPECLSNDTATQRILRRYEFKREWLPSLKQYADSKGIIFLATPFDEEAVDALNGVGVEAYKIASGDLNYSKLLIAVAKKDKPIILSVGMATKKEIQDAIEVIKSAGNNKIILLHCVADYPTKPGDANLLRIKTLRKTFGLPVGFSDHTQGIHIALSSICLGAVVIEKHFTLNRNQRGPDHPFAIEPDELDALVKGTRDIGNAMGDGILRPLKCEKTGLLLGRRSLYAKKYILKGEIISEDNIKVVRPSSGGVPPEFYNAVIGEKARCNIKCNDPITWEKIS